MLISREIYQFRIVSICGSTSQTVEGFNASKLDITETLLRQHSHEYTVYNLRHIKNVMIVFYVYV